MTCCANEAKYLFRNVVSADKIAIRPRKRTENILANEWQMDSTLDWKPRALISYKVLKA